MQLKAGGLDFIGSQDPVWTLSVWIGPVCLDPVCLDPVCLDPVCLDPVCLDPVCLDPVCLDPVCLTLFVWTLSVWTPSVWTLHVVLCGSGTGLKAWSGLDDGSGSCTLLAHDRIVRYRSCCKHIVFIKLMECCGTMHGHAATEHAQHASVKKKTLMRSSGLP